MDTPFPVRPEHGSVLAGRVADYVSSCRGAFGAAVDRTAMREHAVRLAGVTFRLRMAGPALASRVLPALAHLPTRDTSVDGDGQPVSLELWDAASTGVAPPPPPCAPSDYRRVGHRAVVDAGAAVLMHAPADGHVFAYDRSTRLGWWWTADARTLSIYDRAAPLQTLFHWALAEHGWQMVHAGAVGSPAGGVLLIGNTGAGKSTTALSCLDHGNLRLLCDDKCLARIAPAPDHTPQAFAAFSSAKLTMDALDRWPQFRERLHGWDDAAKAGKGLVYLFPEYAARLVSGFPIRALVRVQVTHGGQASCHPMSPGEAFRAFGPSTVIWLPGAEAATFRFTATLARRLPCYRLDLAVEPDRNVDAIARILERCA